MIRGTAATVVPWMSCMSTIEPGLVWLVTRL